jgi:hypothetical protein
MAPSVSLLEPGVSDFLVGIKDTEEAVNLIFSLISPDLYEAGKTAVDSLKEQHKHHKNVLRWPSVFGGLGLISNRITPDHRDVGGCFPWYDILVAAGDYTEAFLDMPDLRTRFAYTPGTVVAVCGKLLRHGVCEWRGGERLCYAHYQRGNVMDRLRQERPCWVKYQSYMKMMSHNFSRRLYRAIGIHT